VSERKHRFPQGLFRDLSPQPLFGTHYVLTNVSSRPLFTLDSRGESATVPLPSILDSGFPRFQPFFRQLAVLGCGLESRLASPVVF